MDAWYELRSPTQFDKCLNPEACQNRTLNQACTIPYHGLLCSLCREGYGINADFQCVECGSRGDEIAVLIVVVASALFISGGLVAYTIYSAEKDDDSYKSGKNIPIHVALTAISMLQSMAFFKGFDYTWPSSLKGLFDASQTASGGGLGLVNMQCVSSVVGGSSYISTEAMMLMLLGPLCLVVFVTALLFLQSLRGGNLKRRIGICIVNVVFLFQPTVVKGILKVMTCTDVGGSLFVYYEMDIECGSSSHVGPLVAVLFGFFVYVMLLPGLNFWTLYKDRELILAQDEEILRSYGFEIMGFTPECYYWNACIMGRKVVQTAFITLSKPMGIVIQSQLAILVSVVALVLQVRCRPYRDSILNRLETISITTFSLTAWLGVLMSQKNMVDDLRELMSILIVLINAAALAYMLWHFVVESRTYVNARIERLSTSSHSDVQTGEEPSALAVEMVEIKTPEEEIAEEPPHNTADTAADCAQVEGCPGNAPRRLQMKRRSFILRIPTNLPQLNRWPWR